MIFPVFPQHAMLLARDLLYTGLTRAKQIAMLIGTTKALRAATHKMTDCQRYTALAHRLPLGSTLDVGFARV